MKLSKQFEAFFAKDCVPVTADEKVEPTRVVWRKFSTVTTRVFPTKQRAWDFALTVKNLIVVQPASDPPPGQSEKRQISNEAFIKFGRNAAARARKQLEKDK